MLVRQLRSPYRTRRVSPASGRFPRARSCTCARRRWKRRAVFTSSSRTSRSAFAGLTGTVRSRSSSGMSGSVRRPTRWRQFNATKSRRRWVRYDPCDSSVLKMISTPLRLALRHDEKFPYLRHGGPAAILHRGEWQSKQHPGLSWQLVAGDFLETVGAGAAPTRSDFLRHVLEQNARRAVDDRDLPPLVRRLCRTRGRAFHLHALDRRSRGAPRRRFLCRQRPPAPAPRKKPPSRSRRPHWVRRCPAPTNCSPRNGSGAGIVRMPSFRPKSRPISIRPSRT